LVQDQRLPGVGVRWKIERTAKSEGWLEAKLRRETVTWENLLEADNAFRGVMMLFSSSQFTKDVDHST
jgi:hypothetical protein